MKRINKPGPALGMALTPPRPTKPSWGRSMTTLIPSDPAISPIAPEL